MSPLSLRLTPRLLGLILGLVALSSPASGQAQVYAPGCGGINPPATVAFSGSLTPGFGSGVHLYGAPPGANIVMVVGAKNANPDGSPIQVPLGHVDGVGATCTLNTSVLVQIPMNADANGEVHLYFTMPDYLGPQLNFQFAVREQITPKSISISQALEVKLAVTARPTPNPLDFGTQQIGSTSTTLTMALVNDSEAPQTILDALIFDGDASDFTAVFASGQTPIVIPPGGSEDIDVTFTPGMPGPRSAQMQIVHDGLPPLMSDPVVTMNGTGIESAGNEIRLNCGASDIYMDSAFNFWAADYGSVTGTQVQSTAPVEGTAEPGLYQTYREGAPVQYDLPLPDGLYEVTLHMAEFSATSTGERWIDVTVEGEKVINNFDIFGEVGQNAAYQVSFITTVADGQLDLDFKGEVGSAVVSAIEVRQQFQALLISPVTSHDFGFLGQGSSDSRGFTFQNMGTTTLHVSSIDFNVNDGAGHEFLIDMDGNQYTGGEGSTSVPASLTLAPGATAPVSVTFTPTEHGPNDVDLVFNGDFSSQTLNVVGTGGSGAHPFLHVVIEPIATAVDYDGNGFEDILLDGSFSHTHEPGADLAGFTWTEGATTLSTLDVETVSLPVGEHTVCLTIEDNNINPGTLIDCATFKVVTPMSVPGVNAQYYETSPSSPASMLDSLPMSPDWIEVLDGFLVDSGAAVGGSPFSTDVVAQLEADVQIDRAGTYYFATTGGADTRLYVGGTPYTGPVSLSGGSVSVEARFAVDTVADLPLEVYLALSGTPPGPIDAADLTHDESLDAPFLNAISPTKGSTAGGNLITLQGSGFFPAPNVTVQWGATQLTDVDFLSITPNAISFSAPSHSAGFISVMVSTPLGSSNVLAFEYTESALPPIVFQMFNISSVHPNKPTCAAWGRTDACTWATAAARSPPSRWTRTTSS